MIDKLHYISQPAADGSHLTAIKNALDAGCKWIQLRIKDQSADNILSYATEAAAICSAYQAKLIINDHPEIALKSGADGVHLGLDDMSIADARAIVGPEFIIGGTANTFADVTRRAAEGVDYIGLGPYRFTTTKKQLSPILGASGYELIVQQCKENNIGLPIIAIGGIEEVDVPHVMQTGVYGLAVSGAITHSADRVATVREIYQHLNAETINS
ncbi:thiamine-phosphate diphosphorylase [Mucilaginibacter yixingensis]|uniref:Thiamine-phosphate synthase n=1 Tax=Mucilaginibacter yixingensis TaxID=1295612 RepID=A0A2T5J9B5_9SPHI|nr:thiamine phosphate synthase [Mucilaginibacter yixingensis]PTQ96660.1 thiamine-phosphate diphosphorylase [Mucilaginibacter yixingensis]